MTFIDGAGVTKRRNVAGWSALLSKLAFSWRENVFSERLSSRRADGRLFQTVGPWKLKLRWPVDVSTLGSSRLPENYTQARECKDIARCVKWPSLKVIRCANRRNIYDFLKFLLALNSNLTSIFNRFWDIVPSMHILTPPLFQVELEKTARSS